ncbi:MAG: serine/threonine-protein kinase [Marinicella sp.]
MNSVEEKRINALFKRVVTMGTADAFEFLNSSEEDAEIIDQVVKLLSDSETRTVFLKGNPELDNLIQSASTEKNLIGQSVANIKLIKLLGKGGMGEVYLGEDEQLQRKVAVKTIRGIYRPHKNAKERFRREALILSKLNHENICKIFNIIEIGDIDFLVLEFVDGETLDNYPVDKLANSEKLRIAQGILNGLVVAHKEGIVHRDIKPDNVIIDQNKNIKILDFGISASTKHQNVLEQSSINEGFSVSKTEAGTIVGTLGYMSPEQANQEKVDTASDIYSLGIIFQDMFSRQAAHQPNLSNQDLFSRAKSGITDAVKGAPVDMTYLINRMKSIKPASRPTAFDAMIMIEKIIAKPKRRAKLLLTLALVLISILVFSKYTLDLKQQKQQAESAKTMAQKAQKEAETARDEAEQVTKFLGGFFTASDPYLKLGEEITASQILADGVKRVDEELKNNPAVLIKMKSIIANIYRKQGAYDLARTQFEQVLQLFQNRTIVDIKKQIAIMADLSELELFSENYQRAEELSSQAVHLAENHSFTENSYYLKLKFNQAAAFEEQGKHQQAIDLFHQLLQFYLKDEEHHKLDLVTVYNYIGLIKANSGDYLSGKADMERALTYLDENNDEDMEYKTVLRANLATIYTDLQQYDKAIETGLEIAAYREKILGHNHPYTAITYDQISRAYRALNNYEKAKEYNDIALEIYHSNDLKSIDYATVLGNKAQILMTDSESYLEAEQLFKKAISTIVDILGTDNNRFVADQMVSLSENYMVQHKFDMALVTITQALDIYNELKRPMKRHVVRAWKNLASIHLYLGNETEAFNTYQLMLSKALQETKPDDELINEIQLRIESLVKDQ